MKKYRILFICYGNICRSPMAEFIMKDLLSKEGLSDGIEVASAATSDEEIWSGVGNPIYPPARRELMAHGIFPDERRAVRITADDAERYDMLICMEERNRRDSRRIFGNRADEKLFLIGDFSGLGDVCDPWYSGDFASAFSDIEAGCRALLEHLRSNELI